MQLIFSIERTDLLSNEERQNLIHNVREYTTENFAKLIKKKRSAFIKPTFEEVKDCFIEAGMPAGDAIRTAHKFINHYESNGWKVGKTKMVSWEAAVKGTWMGTYRENHRPNFGTQQSTGMVF